MDKRVPASVCAREALRELVDGPPGSSAGSAEPIMLAAQLTVAELWRWTAGTPWIATVVRGVSNRARAAVIAIARRPAEGATPMRCRRSPVARSRSAPRLAATYGGHGLL